MAMPSVMVILRVIGSSSGMTGLGGAIDGKGLPAWRAAGPRIAVPDGRAAAPGAWRGRVAVGCIGRGSPGRREGAGRGGIPLGDTAGG